MTQLLMLSVKMRLIRISLLLLTLFPLFQFGGKNKNELDLSLLFCQAEEELLKLRKEEKIFVEFPTSYRAGSRTSGRALALSNSSLLYEIVTKKMYKAGASPRVPRSAEGGVRCDGGARYRSHSGECNNLQAGRQGSSHSLQRRILPSSYSDGVSRPRDISVTGTPLPSARKISQTLHQDTLSHDRDQ